MVWYPTVDDIVCLNILALDMSRDPHPHKLIGSTQGIKVKIEQAIQREHMGLVHQAAFLIRELAGLHVFAGGNHRTAYAVGKSFLIRNGRRLRAVSWEAAYPFIKNVELRTVAEIEEWIRYA